MLSQCTFSTILSPPITRVRSLLIKHLSSYYNLQHHHMVISRNCWRAHKQKEVSVFLTMPLCIILLLQIVPCPQPTTTSCYRDFSLPEQPKTILRTLSYPHFSEVATSAMQTQLLSWPFLLFPLPCLPPPHPTSKCSGSPLPWVHTSSLQMSPKIIQQVFRHISWGLLWEFIHPLGSTPFPQKPDR